VAEERRGGGRGREGGSGTGGGRGRGGGGGERRGGGGGERRGGGRGRRGGPGGSGPDDGGEGRGRGGRRGARGGERGRQPSGGRGRPGPRREPPRRGRPTGEVARRPAAPPDPATEEAARRRAATAARLAELDEVEVEIEKLVAGGDGLGRVDGIPFFVPRSAPGDRLRVRLVERRPDYARAEIVEVLAPGPGRREPPCPYFDRCGGCDLQHMEDGLQLRLKTAAALETLVRLGGVDLPEPEVVAGGAWAYRLRTQLHTRGEGDAVEVGYFERGSRELVAVAACPILVPELESLLPDLPGQLAEKAPRRLDLAAGGRAGISLPPDDPAVGQVTTAPVVPGLPHGEIALEVPDPGGGEPLTYAFDARVFFQAHRELVAELVARAVGPWEGEEAFDLYAGVGLFALPLARRHRRVVAVEGDAPAARYARINARRNRLPNVEVERLALDAWIGQLPAAADRAVVDPPRGGLSRKVRAVLLERRPHRLTYVSCHPAVLARDLRFLSQVYRVESLAVLDMFPQSGHVETVAQLVPA